MKERTAQSLRAGEIVHEKGRPADGTAREEPGREGSLAEAGGLLLPYLRGTVAQLVGFLQ